ncbi:PREDICTED: uncharacterized protein LOC104756807 [Camelina sativa]|uniref:Uncharacterized protein LOC104756807 n=1 Tax=Camelina sativa TaxID=90675 RepID=A0ABM1R5J8_CAMSA|nr:PREDICTED: uncharacterized protein LOC104756807 [Camelina sativa]
MGKMNMSVPNASARYRRASDSSSVPRPTSQLDGRRDHSSSGAGSAGKVSSRSRQSSDAPPRHQSQSLPLVRRSEGSGRDTEGVKGPPKRKDDASLERPDPSKKQRTLDFGWDFSHTSEARPFPNDSSACSELFRRIHFGPGRLPSVDQMKEAHAVADVAQASFEVCFCLFCSSTRFLNLFLSFHLFLSFFPSQLVARINRLTSRYERRVRDQEDDRSGASSYAEKIERLEAQLGEAVRSNQRLSDEASKFESQRRKWISERDDLKAKLEASDAAYNRMHLTLNSETKRLRDRREDFGYHERIKAFNEMAVRVQKLLAKHKRYAEAVKASMEKFLEYNQAVGNVQMLETLVEEGQIAVLEEGLKDKVVAVMTQLKGEVDDLDLPDITEADFDVSRIYSEPLPPVPEWIASPLSGDAEGGDDVREEGEFGSGGPEGNVGEQAKGDDRPAGGIEEQTVDRPTEELPRPLTPGCESPTADPAS